MRFDEERRLRVLTDVVSFEDLACPAFAAIARYGLGDADVIAQLLRVMDALSQVARPEASKAIRELSDGIRRESGNEAVLDIDRRRVRA